MSDILKIKNHDLSLLVNGESIRVISSADLTVGKGEIVGLIGESGSGKSMLWKSALGLADPSRWSIEGEVELNGKTLSQKDPAGLLAARGKDVSVILQDPMSSFDQVFTIERHFIETAAAHTDWSKTEILRKACELLKRLYIREPEKVLKMYPFQCSGGMLQRIMIAIALMMDTPLIIADEPTTSVDVTIQREIVSMLKEVNKDYGAGILYISHDLKIIESIADRIYVMYAGYMVESFPAHVLTEGKMVHPYTRKLMQSRPSFTRETLPALKGNPPTLAERQSVCPFAPRCDMATEACRGFDMRAQNIGEKHTIRCCRWEEAGGSDRS